VRTFSSLLCSQLKTISPATCSYIVGRFEKTYKDEKYKSTMDKALADSKITLIEFGAYMQPREC